EQVAKLEIEFANVEVAAYVPQLVERKWLTQYQADQILAGSGDGLVLGQYRILDRLGEGGMAQVYKAEHVLMKRQVAIKVIASRPVSELKPGCDDLESAYLIEEAVTGISDGAQRVQTDPGAIDRFHQEVQIAAQLDHANIVRAHDAAEARGLFFLVMEYVDGVDLGARVAQGGPLPVALACEYVRQAALGLQYANERSLIHRDIKPSNLLVTCTGVVKILDLGLARLAGAIAKDLSGQSTSSDVSGLSGTPDYMAPETAQDSRCADIRSDLYSLGCTFYFLLTGQAPFPGGGWPEKLLRHQLDSAPSVVVLRPDVPAEIAAILQRLMAKNPSQRPATPAELAADLQAWLTAHGATADPMPPLLTATANGTPAPTVSLNQLTPSAAPVPDPSTAAAKLLSAPATPNWPPRRWPALSWPLGLAAAAIVGLSAALLLRGSGDRIRKTEELDAGSSPPASRNPNGDFELDGVGRFPTLPAAITAAPDDATIIIHGNGPFRLNPLRLHGKSLTLRAGEGYRPRFDYDAASNGQPWQSLLSADRPLRLEGVDLVRESNSENGTNTTHLVYVERASLVLTDCTLRAPNGSACVVCRDCREVRLDGCRLTAGALALCVETGASGTEVRMHDTRIEVSGPNDAALSLWAADKGADGILRLHVDNCKVRGGRAIAFGVLPRHVEISTRRAHFTFHDALVSYACSAGPDDWRRATTWREDDNTYDGGSAGWLRVNGRLEDVPDLPAWQNLWSRP
ncbi:MAG TPA: protein kinase, partial [Gemmataceae bacterium]|nr:protein kinase [Gemmataceae bacterium]